jgi:hypothetical protein
MQNKYQKRDEEMELNNICYDVISDIQHGEADGLSPAHFFRIKTGLSN